MKAQMKTFFELTADDLMTHPVEVLPEDMLLADAARLLARAQVSGAPVVDGAGRCVGVLSASDFVAWAERGAHAEKVRCTASCCSDWQVMDLEFLPKDEVRWHMTADPVMVSPTTPIIEVAETMVDAHIHRVVVVDAEHRPVGIVSNTDIVAAVSRAVKAAKYAEKAAIEPAAT
jgi:CBS domain-containing membrane protein